MSFYSSCKFGVPSTTLPRPLTITVSEPHTPALPPPSSSQAPRATSPLSHNGLQHYSVSDSREGSLRQRNLDELSLQPLPLSVTASPAITGTHQGSSSDATPLASANAPQPAFARREKLSPCTPVGHLSVPSFLAAGQSKVLSPLHPAAPLMSFARTTTTTTHTTVVPSSLLYTSGAEQRPSVPASATSSSTPPYPKDHYERHFSLEARLSECARLRRRHPGMVPMVVEGANTDPKLHFLALPVGSSVRDLAVVVREEADLPSRQPLTLAVNGRHPGPGVTLGTLHRSCARGDGFLHVVYRAERRYHRDGTTNRALASLNKSGSAARASASLLAPERTPTTTTPTSSPPPSPSVVYIPMAEQLMGLRPTPTTTTVGSSPAAPCVVDEASALSYVGSHCVFENHLSAAPSCGATRLEEQRAVDREHGGCHHGLSSTPSPSSSSEGRHGGTAGGAPSRPCPPLHDCGAACEASLMSLPSHLTTSTPSPCGMTHRETDSSHPQRLRSPLTEPVKANVRCGEAAYVFPKPNDHSRSCSGSGSNGSMHNAGSEAFSDQSDHEGVCVDTSHGLLF